VPSRRTEAPNAGGGADGVTGRVPLAVRLARGCILVSPAETVLRPLKTSETVARDIVHDIVERRLHTGAGLPHEAAMLRQYGVSRESLREALRLLEVQGLITIRRGPGGGPVVGSIDPANLGRVASLFFHVAGATYDELFDAWVVSERTLAELAAANSDRGAVRAAMEPFLGPHDLDDAENLAEFVLLHTHFHAVVASLVDNQVLELLLQTVGQIVTHQVAVTSDPRRMHELIAADHAKIAKALSNGHARKAGTLMEEHVLAMTATYRRERGDQMKDFVEWR
jgi:GntR family transcriptional regulator, transcriptional repressor for pyruvate dehydrogenase complex